ncbi:hypothetical protein BXY82_3022 [Gelidibacter sediminis]|uniref:Uncharacterized protein n=1 Tax=Gelidibacter sediminis TaxID=1608710 RepID=A0A4V3F6R8_9FLAO|nr:hypothetical protein BXY82_3022 [Gelidibacter sediminis]
MAWPLKKEIKGAIIFTAIAKYGYLSKNFLFYLVTDSFTEYGVKT